jgi:hypothetical protein
VLRNPLDDVKSDLRRVTLPSMMQTPAAPAGRAGKK